MSRRPCPFARPKIIVQCMKRIVKERIVHLTAIQTTSTSSGRASPRFQRRDNHRTCSVNTGEASGRCKSRRSTPSQQYRKQRCAYRYEAPLDTLSIKTWDMVIFMQLIACSRLLWHGLHSTKYIKYVAILRFIMRLLATDAPCQSHHASSESRTRTSFKLSFDH